MAIEFSVTLLDAQNWQRNYWNKYLHIKAKIEFESFTVPSNDITTNGPSYSTEANTCLSQISNQYMLTPSYQWQSGIYAQWYYIENRNPKF